MNRRHTAGNGRTRGAAAGRYAAVFVLAAALALAVAGSAGALPPHLLWSDIWGPGVGSDTYSDTAPTTDGGFVAAGAINDSSSGDGADLVVTKFAANDGAPNHKELVRTWNGSAGLNDTTSAVTSDLQGGVTMCGYTLTASGRRDWEIVKWSAAGAFQWAETYSPDLANSRATATDVCCDGAGDVYVCGSTQTAANAASLVVRKLDGGSGRHHDDVGVALQLRGRSLYVLGGMFMKPGIPRSVALARYSTAGARTWLRTWRESTSAVANPVALAVDKYGGVAVAGSSAFASGRQHAFLVKWNKSGTRTWARISYPSASKVRGFSDVVGDPAGHLWVSGFTKTADGDRDWLTARYQPDGRRAWLSPWNGPSGLDDSCSTIGLTVSGRLFTAGRVTSAFNEEKAAAARYAR